jgi:hypothetical protein
VGYQVIGADGEMTGSTANSEKCAADIWQLIQIGVAVAPDDVFVSDIGYPPGEYSSETEAMIVNRFTFERIEKGPSKRSVDYELVKWLVERDATKLILCGWNVGSFDMPFFQRYLPQFSQLFSYRSVDLNAVCITIAGGMNNRFKKLKKSANWYAEERLEQLGTYSGVAKWHDAGYDAAAALLCWEYLRDRINRT